MRLYPIILIILLLACKEKQQTPSPLLGKSVPDFELTKVDSTHYSSKEIPQNKPFAIIFFGPTCPYSRAQLTEITENSNKLKNVTIYLLAVSSLEEIRQISNEFSLNKYSNIIIGKDEKYFFPTYYKTTGVPTTVIYGKDKKLKEIFLGQVSTNEIKSITANN